MGTGKTFNDRHTAINTSCSGQRKSVKIALGKNKVMLKNENRSFRL